MDCPHFSSRLKPIRKCRLCGDQAHGAFSPHRSIAEAGEADQHHGPGRGLGDSRRNADVEREVLVGPGPPRPFIDAGGRAEAGEGLVVQVEAPDSGLSET